MLNNEDSGLLPHKAAVVKAIFEFPHKLIRLNGSIMDVPYSFSLLEREFPTVYKALSTEVRRLSGKKYINVDLLKQTKFFARTMQELKKLILKELKIKK